MATLFTRIINGEIPGRFVWRDDRAVAFMTIAPIKPGHVLVVPIEEVDHWLDAPADLRNHLMDVAARIGTAQMEAFGPPRIGVIIAGLEVPHLHIHVIPMETERDLNFANADPSATEEALNKATSQLRKALVGNSDAVTD
jgi:histidine triad (HIT) family protein